MTQFQPVKPIVPTQSILCQWGKRAVAVDINQGVIEFRHCLVEGPIGLWSQPLRSCSVAEIKGVFFMRGKRGGATLTVVTATGKVVIPNSATNFGRLMDWLDEVTCNDPAYSVEGSMAIFVYVIVGAIGVIAALHWSENASHGTMALAALLGALSGVASSYLLILSGGYLLKADISFGMYGAIFGIMFGLALYLLIGGSVATVAVAGVLGTYLGTRSGSKSKQ